MTDSLLQAAREDHAYATGMKDALTATSLSTATSGEDRLAHERARIRAERLSNEALKVIVANKRRRTA